MTRYQKEAEKYLGNIRKIEKRIQSKELKLEALRYKASGAGAIQYDKEHVQTSPQNYMEMAMADIDEIISEIEEDKASLEEVKGQAYSIIRNMNITDQQTVITWYYLNCVSIMDICQKMHKSERNVYYLKDDALETFGKLLTKK